MVKVAARAYGVDALELMRIAFIDDDEPEKRPSRKRRSSYDISPRKDIDPL